MDDLKRQYDIQPLKQADMSILVNGQAVNAAQGEIWDIGYLGDFSVFIVRDENGRTMRAAQANIARLVDRPITYGDMVWLSWKAESGLVLTR